MLVDSINNDRPQEATENTVLGPFHVANAPQYDNGADICLDGKGEPLTVHGRVADIDGNPVAGAIIAVCQANQDGFYDVPQTEDLPTTHLRGLFFTEENQEHWYPTK